MLERISGMAFDQTLKLALYGRSATGKTTVWSTFPKPILAIICSGGQKPGELKSINTPENRKGIQQVTLEDPDEMFQLLEHQQQTRKYATVVLDHASGLQDLTLKDVLGLDEIPVQKTWGMATQTNYGTVAIRMKEYLRAMLNLDNHVVIVTQERDFSEDEAGAPDSIYIPSIGPALMPSVTGWLNPACDAVCQTLIRQKMEWKEGNVKGPDGKKAKTLQPVKDEVEYCLRTAPHPVYMSKFRVPKQFTSQLPPVIVDPSFEKIDKLLKGMKL